MIGKILWALGIILMAVMIVWWLVWRANTANADCAKKGMEAVWPRNSWSYRCVPREP